jgi:hypothetical protein
MQDRRNIISYLTPIAACKECKEIANMLATNRTMNLLLNVCVDCPFNGLECVSECANKSPFDFVRFVNIGSCLSTVHKTIHGTVRQFACLRRRTLIYNTIRNKKVWSDNEIPLKQRLIKQAAGLVLRTQFVQDDTRWRASQRDSQMTWLKRSI